MSRLIFMLEEQSMKVLLDGLLPRLFGDLKFLWLAHEGKSDLEESIRTKLKAWRHPEDRFVVVRDNDGGDCVALKTALAALCSESGRPESLVRIVCQELEAWYFGQPDALSAAFDDPSLRKLGGKARYRNSDAITQPARQLSRLCARFQKVSGARLMAKRITYAGNKSPSFRAFVDGVARVSSRAIVAQKNDV